MGTGWPISPTDTGSLPPSSGLPRPPLEASRSTCAIDLGGGSDAISLFTRCSCALSRL
jgi:hypothetical protein